MSAGFNTQNTVVTKVSKLIYNPTTPDSVKNKLYANRSKKTQTKLQLEDLINYKKDDKQLSILSSEKNSQIKTDLNENNNKSDDCGILFDLPNKNLSEKPSLTSRKSKTDISLKLSRDETAKKNDGKLSKQRSKSTTSIKKHVNYTHEHEELARKRSYDPEEARKYIREQKLKRKSLNKNLPYEAGTTFGNKYQKNTKYGYDREEIKKRLMDLHKRTQKIIERNVKIAKKKNEELNDNYQNKISYNSHRGTSPSDKTKLKRLEDVKFSDRNKGKILRKSISDVTCMASIKEDTESMQSEQNELRTENPQLRKKKVGLLRRSSDLGFSPHLSNIDDFTNISNKNTPKFTLIQPRSILVSKSKPKKNKNNVSENVRILIDGELMLTQSPPSEFKVGQQQKQQQKTAQQKQQQQQKEQEDAEEEEQKTIQNDTEQQQQKSIQNDTQQQQQPQKQQNMLENDDLKLSVPETSLKTSTISIPSLEEKSIQVSSSLLQPQTTKPTTKVPSEVATKVTKIPSYWLKPTPLQIYPYNFIMAVRRKLEAITTSADGPEIQQTSQKKSTQRKTSKLTLSSVSNHNSEHKPEEISPITLSSSKIFTNSTNSKYNTSTFSSSSTSAAIKSSFNNKNQKNIQHLKQFSNNDNGNIIESLKENIYSNKATKESSTSLSELLSNLSSITINIPKSGIDNCGEHQTTTISEISSIKSDSVNISPPLLKRQKSQQKLSQIHKNSIKLSKNQDNDDTTVSSSVFSSPEKQQQQQNNNYHQIQATNNNNKNDYTYEIQKDSTQKQQDQNDMKNLYDILNNDNDNLIVPSFKLKRQNINLDNLSENKNKSYENENSLHSKFNKNTNSNNHHNSTNAITMELNNEQATNDLDFEQFLEDFNKNLTQVIEANEQIKTGITPRIISNENNDIENTIKNLNDLYSSDFEENYETHSKSNESNIKNNNKIITTKTKMKITPPIITKLSSSSSSSTITTRINSNSSISSNTITDNNNQIQNNDNDFLNSKNTKILSNNQNLKLNNFDKKQEKIIKSSSSSTLNNLEDNLLHDNNYEHSISEEISLIEKNNSSDDKILISNAIEIVIEEEISRDDELSNNKNHILSKDSNGGNNNDDDNDDDKTIVQSDYWKSHINTSRGDFYINDKSNNFNKNNIPPPEYNSIESFKLYNKNLSKYKKITTTTTNANATTTTIVSTIPKSIIETNYVNAAAAAAATTITNATTTTTTTGEGSATTLNQSDDKDLSIISFLDNFSDTTLNYSTIGLYEQLLKVETTKSEYLSAMLKIREKSLMDRTRSQVAWLEVQKEKCKAKGLTIEISAIKKKQRAILMKMEKEREEIQNLLKSRSQTTTDKSSIRKNIMSPKLSEELLNVSFRKNLSINNINSGGGGGVCGAISGNTSGSGGSNNSMIRGYELESCRSLEIILKKRENELRKRREHIKKLLEWHQRLDKEEKEMNEIEKMLFNYNKIYYNQRQQHNHHHYKDEKRNDDNQINKKLLSSSSSTTMSLLSHSEIYTKKIHHINKSLKELQNIPDYKNSNKINKNDNDNENQLIEFKNNDYIKIMGKNLNKLWKNLTGHTQDKFEKERLYKINRKNLEKIYEKAKQVVLNDFNYAQKNNLKKFLFNETVTTGTTTNTSSTSIKLNKIDNNDKEKSFEKRKSERKELKEGNSFSSLVFSNISISHSFTIDDNDNDNDDYDDDDDVDRNDQVINRKTRENKEKLYQQQQQQQPEINDYDAIVPLLNLGNSTSSLSIQSSDDATKIQSKSQQSINNSISEAISEQTDDYNGNTNTDKAIEESIQTIENNSDEIVNNDNTNSGTNNTIINSSDLTDESVPVSFDVEKETNNKINENRIKENVHSEIEEDNLNSDGDDDSSSHNSIKSEISNFINKSSSTVTDQEILSINKIDTDTNDSFNNLNNKIHEENEDYSENFDVITETQIKESSAVIITDSNKTVPTVSEQIIQNQINTDTISEISPTPSSESINTLKSESNSIQSIIQKSNEINKEISENLPEEIYIKNNEKNEIEKENISLSESNDISSNNLNLQKNESFSPSFLTILSSSSIKSEILELSNLENIQNTINNSDYSYKSNLNGNIAEDKVNDENQINDNDNENNENLNSEKIMLQKKNSQNLNNNKLNLSFDLSQLNDDDTMIQNISLPEFETTFVENDNDDDAIKSKNFNEQEHQQNDQQLNENDKMIQLLEFKSTVITKHNENEELEILNEQEHEEILTEDENYDDKVKEEKNDNSENDDDNDDDRTTPISPVSSESNELKQRLIHIGESLMELHQTFERALSPEKSVTPINSPHKDLKGQLEQQSITSLTFHDEQLMKNSSSFSSFITEDDNNDKIIEENYQNENLNQYKFSLSSLKSISDANSSNTTYIPSSMNVIDTTIAKVSTTATTAPTTVRNYLAYSDSNNLTTSSITTTTTTVTTTSSSTGLMPDIINEVELRRRQQILFENEIRQLEHEVPYVFLREIPNKPPPPYVPPAHGSPMTAIFPSEQRIQEITFRRTKELYEEIINESANNKNCEKTDSILDENITNIYERIILDICKERIDELKSSILNTNNLQINSLKNSLQSSPTSSLLKLNYKYPLALYNPPDRLKCLQIIIYKHIRKVLAMDKKLVGTSSSSAINSSISSTISTSSSSSSSLYGNNLNYMNSLSLYEKNNQKTIYSKIYDLSRKKCIDHVDEILLQELNDDEQKWTNFDVEENEIKKRVINDIFNDILNEIMNECILTHNKKKKQQYNIYFDFERK